MKEHPEQIRFSGGWRLQRRQRTGLGESSSHAFEQAEGSREFGELRVDGCKNAQLAQAPDDAGSRPLLRNQQQLGEDPRTGEIPDHPPFHCCLYQPKGGPSNNKSVSGFKPSCSENTGGVVDEAPFVQDPDLALLLVLKSSKGIDQRAEPMAIDTGCHGVDAEVAPSKIGRERGRANLGKGRGFRISLGPGGGNVKVYPFGQAQARGPEAWVRCHRHLEGLSHTSRHSDGIPLDHEIDIDIAEAEEQVPNIAADCIDGGGCGSLSRRLKGPSGYGVQRSKLRELSQMP